MNLPIKISGFEEGQKIFFRNDGTYEISEEEFLPAGFEFGVDMPKLNGFYVVTSPIGAFALFISGIDEGDIIIDVGLNSIFIATSSRPIHKLTYPTTIVEEPVIKPELDSTVEVINYTKDGGYVMAYTRENDFNLQLVKVGPDGNYSAIKDLTTLDPPFTVIYNQSGPKYKNYPANVLGVLADSSYWYVYLANTSGSPYQIFLLKVSFTDSLDSSYISLGEGSTVFPPEIGVPREQRWYTNSLMGFDGDGNITILIARNFLAKFSRNLDLLSTSGVIYYYEYNGLEYIVYPNNFSRRGNKYYLPCSAIATIPESGDQYYRTVIVELEDTGLEMAFIAIYEVFTPHTATGNLTWGYHDVHSSFVSEGVLYGVGTIWSSEEYGYDVTTGLVFAYDLTNQGVKYWREEYDSSSGDYIDFYSIGRLSNYIYAGGWTGYWSDNIETIYAYNMETGVRVGKLFTDVASPFLTNMGFYSTVS